MNFVCHGRGTTELVELNCFAELVSEVDSDTVFLPCFVELNS